MKLSACKCGGGVRVRGPWMRGYRASCDEVLTCDASTAWYPTQAEAVAAWERMSATGDAPDDGRPQGWTEASAINVALDIGDNWDAIAFLKMFQHGEWKAIREEFPEEANTLDKSAALSSTLSAASAKEGE